MNESDLRRLIQPDHGLSEDRHDTLKQQLMANVLTDLPATTDAAPEPVDITKRRRGKILIGAFIAVFAVGGAAAAGSLFPDDDVPALLPIGDCRTESSIEEIVATTQRSNGNTLQLFTTKASAQASANGYALIESDPDGQAIGGASSCDPPGTPDSNGELWVSGPSQAGADGVFIWLIGKAPAPATRVEINLSDGDIAHLDVQIDGYFLGEIIRPGVEFDPKGSAPPVPWPTHIRTFDADGNLIQGRAQ